MQHCVSVYSVLLFYIIVFYFFILFFTLHLGDFTVHTPVISQRSEDSSFCIVLSNIVFFCDSPVGEGFFCLFVMF